VTRAVEGFKDHFSSHAAGYAAYRPRYPEAVLAYLGAIAPDRLLAWDCGCGSGQLSVPLGDWFAEVVATDASMEQIARAGTHPRVTYRVGTAEAGGLTAGSVDLVTVAQAVHWFDLPAFYAEVRRVLRPDGVIALVSYGVTVVNDAIDPVIAAFHDRELAAYWPPERAAALDGYRSLPFPFRPVVPPAVDMRAEWTLARMLGYVDTWSAVRAMEAAVGRAPFDRFAERLAAVWGPADTARTVRWPVGLRIGRV
jgi:SAM-dependent methyltransferase